MRASFLQRDGSVLRHPHFIARSDEPLREDLALEPAVFGDEHRDLLRDPKPGDSPRPGQPYYITIQIKVPEGRRRFPMSDLAGIIVGTDRYQQRLPQHTYVLDQNGQPTRPRGSIPVIDGVVQFLVFVPGARELVKDTIEISSEMLNEEQKLELVIESLPPLPDE